MELFFYEPGIKAHDLEQFELLSFTVMSESTSSDHYPEFLLSTVIKAKLNNTCTKLANEG